MQRALLGLTFGVIAVIGMPCLAAAQGGSAKSTLTGTVVDEGGAVLPGATVVVKNASTGVETTVVTNSTGAFDVPVLDAGTYVLTVSLEGFRTSMVTDLELLATTRQSTFMGLPTGSVAITVDGVSVQDKYTRSTDGFFANNQPRLDMVEEVTVSSATPGADSSGQGAVRIKFVMRSGTNRFLGSAYEYTRHPKLNSNTWFNIPEQPAEERNHPQPVRRARGRPHRDPGRLRWARQGLLLLQRGAAPLSAEQHAHAKYPRATRGAGDLPVRRGHRASTANLLELAARSGQTSTLDPTIAGLIAKIRTATASAGVVNNVTDPNVQEYVWQPDSLRIDNVPGGRLDFNLTSAHRLSASYNYQGQRLTPNMFGNDEPNYPGLLNSAELYSAVSRGSGTLRSTFGTNVVNELRVGFSNAPVYFADSVVPDHFADQSGSDLAWADRAASISGSMSSICSTRSTSPPLRRRAAVRRSIR